MMKKHIVLLMMTLLPLGASAQSVTLNKLLMINTSNFCFQQLTKPQNMVSFFSMQQGQQFSLASKPVSNVVVSPPVVSIVTTSQDIKNDLLKTEPKKYSANDLAQANIKNVYNINHTMTMTIAMSPALLSSYLNTHVPGLTFDTENFKAQAYLTPVIHQNPNSAKNVKEFMNLMDKANAVMYDFTLTQSSPEQTIIKYQCHVNFVSSLDIDSIQNMLK